MVNMVNKDMLARKLSEPCTPSHFKMKINSIDTTRTMLAIANSTTKILATTVILDAPLPSRKVFIIHLINQSAEPDVRAPQPPMILKDPRVRVPQVV
jgi:hypothetical protein